GAVHYGSNPSVIKARVSRFTYGVSHGSTFDPSNPVHMKHESRKVYDDKAKVHRLQRLFDPFIRVGEQVAVDHTVTMDYSPVYDDQSVLGVQMYHCDFIPTFSDEEGVTLLGEKVCVGIPNLGERGIKAVMHFGDTEIRMQVIPDDPNCPPKDTTVKFSCK
ncbi:hypothetical protein KIPB_010371, partial [Kipferlia bialata]